MVERGVSHRGVMVLALSAGFVLAGSGAGAAEKSRPKGTPKAAPSPLTRGAEPSPERTRDLQATIARRKQKRARSARLRAANQAAADAQQLTLFLLNSGGMSSSTDTPQLLCMDCGAAFTGQPFLSLPPGLDISHGVRLSVPFSMHT